MHMAPVHSNRFLVVQAYREEVYGSYNWNPKNLHLYTFRLQGQEYSCSYNVNKKALN